MASDLLLLTSSPESLSKDEVDSSLDVVENLLDNSQQLTQDVRATAEAKLFLKRCKTAKLFIAFPSSCVISLPAAQV